MKYYTSRELSKKLAINLAKWKRWTREFLPPDPLGGLQSGYARQYTLKEAFIVFLAGRAVGELCIPVPLVKTMLGDVAAWLDRNNIPGRQNGGCNNEDVMERILVVFGDPVKSGIGYFIRYIKACRNIEDAAGFMTEMIFRDEEIQSNTPPFNEKTATSVRMLYLTRTYEAFCKKLEIYPS